METISFIVGLLYQYADTIALLALSAIGLIIIFGMMGVINMAHGEMMMIGAYITSFSYYAGIPTALAVIFGGIGAGVAGMVLERLVIRRFYGQLLSSLVATWGLSLILSQGALLVFGQLIQSVPTPFGSFTVADLSYSYYRVFIFLVALVMIGGPLGALPLHPLWGARAGDHGKPADGARAWCRYHPRLRPHLRARHYAWGLRRRSAGTDVDHRPLLRHDLYAAGLHHGSCWRRR